MPGNRSVRIKLIKWTSLIAAALSLFCAGLPAAAGSYGGLSFHAAAVAPSSQETPDKAILAFHTAAQGLYDSIRQLDRLRTTQSMLEVERSFRRLPMEQIPTSEGVAALAGSISEMKRALASVSPDDARIERAAGSIRLAADALANPAKPLWHEYQSVLSQDVKALTKALEAADTSTTTSGRRTAFDTLNEHYGIIRTAASIQSEPSVIERVDSVLRYTGRLLASDQPQKSLFKGLGTHIEEAIAALFPRTDGAPANVVPLAPPTWGITATIGSFIITILSWAGWRRFKFDRDHPGKKSESSRNRKDAANRWIR